MAGVAWPFNETYVGGVAQGVPAVTARQKRQMNASFVGMGSAARPLGAKSGVRPGTPASVVSITGSGPYTWSAGGFGGTIDAESNAAAGAYQYSFENPDTGTIAAAGAATRKDRLDVQLSDSDEGDGTGAKTVATIYTQGPATGGTPAAAPPRSHLLGYINVPTTGAPTFTWAPEWAGAPGEWWFNTYAEMKAYSDALTAANVPVNQRASVLADTTTSNNGDWVWSGTAWVPVATAYQVGAFTPASGGIYSAGTPTPQATRTGNRVFLEGVITSSSATFATNTVYTLGTIPAAFAPSSTRSFLVFVSSGNLIGYITVNTTGTISLVLITGGFTGALSLVLEGQNWRM
ncbi:hypothetical protein [Humibacter sp.]|uniref:hypothetical protein n=1 Tax=Humibacter sp. TaxID=1940291 RepID=UPI003F815E2D